MKKSHVFLTPASADKKGEVVEMEYNDEPAQFAEPVSPYAVNDALGILRDQHHKAASALRIAKSKGGGVAEAQKAFDAAKTAVGKAHYDQQQERQRQRVGGDSPFGPHPTGDTRMFAEIVDYSRNDTETDSSGATFDDEADDELEAAIRKAVDDLEQAQAKGASPAKMEKLAAALKVLRDQLPNPSAPPADTTAAPPRRSSVPEDSPGSKPAGQSFREYAAAVAAAVGDPAVKKKPTKAETKAGWDKHLADLDKWLAARALAVVYPMADNPASSSPTAKAAHARNTCCSDARYLCPACQRKKAAA